MEADEQARLVRWCKQHGLVTRKLSSNSMRGFPDLFVGSPHKQRAMLLEIKTKSGRLSRPQRRTIASLLECGMTVAVPRSLDDAIQLIEREFEL